MLVHGTKNIEQDEEGYSSKRVPKDTPSTSESESDSSSGNEDYYFTIPSIE